MDLFSIEGKVALAPALVRDLRTAHRLGARGMRCTLGGGLVHTRLNVVVVRKRERTIPKGLGVARSDEDTPFSALTHPVIADGIETRFGHQAIQAPGLPTGGHQPPFSMMLAAVLAGLGTRSLAANIILNPKFGLLYYSACFTTLKLDYDQMLEQDVCPHPMCVETFRHFGKTPCIAACPSDEGGCLDGSIDANGRIEYSYYDRERCVSRAMNFGINSFQKALAQIVAEDDEDRQSTMVQSDFFSRSCSAITHYKESVAQCFECMRVCPIGRQERKLK